MFEPNQFAFELDKHIAVPNSNGPVVLKWRSPQQLPLLEGRREQDNETKIDQSIDAGMLLDGYQRNLRRAR